MVLLPAMPDWDVAAWRRAPAPVRLRMICQAWAAQGYGSPLAIYAAYGLKILAYVGVWALACARIPGNDLAHVGGWWSSDEAFRKAIVWTMLFEGLGLGCGSGPLTGRYVPPLGGALYFLRPGWVKLPLVPGLPLLGGTRRTLLDVGLYAAVVLLLGWALWVPEITPSLLAPLLVLVPLLGLADKTTFLAFRSEHYLSVIVCLCLAGGRAEWIAGAKAVWLAIWWWAATSKVNAHFPAVMCVMTSNAPWTRWGPLRRRVYRDPPHDLRPSAFAARLAHTGTVAEYAFPLALLLTAGTPWVVPVLLFASSFHLFILSNVPRGVPLEWNVIMVYGAWVLFGVHDGVSVASLHSPLLLAWLVGFHLALPLYGSVWPSQVSFLLSMRYYAGNWAWSVWLFRPSALDKLDRRVPRASPLTHHQLARFYDEDTIEVIMARVQAFRLMHLHGRMLHDLLPLAVDDLDQRVWVDGEIVAGLVLGWNFGEGHLHDEQLLAALQERCAFEPGELRCVFVESQPLFGRSLAWRVVDARDGRVAAGSTEVDQLVERHPWPETV